MMERDESSSDGHGNDGDASGHEQELPIAQRLKEAAGAEKRLLRAEAAAEKDVNAARARLAKAAAKLRDAEARYRRRAGELDAAESSLRARQEARMTGPYRRTSEPGTIGDGQPDSEPAN